MEILRQTPGVASVWEDTGNAADASPSQATILTYQQPDEMEEKQTLKPACAAHTAHSEKRDDCGDSFTLRVLP